MKNTKVFIQDSTLRDGNHAVQHQLSSADVANYCKLAEKANIPAVEVGHGNGLGASSFQVGFSKTSDAEMLKIARKCLKKTKLAVHCMPGFATIDRDLSQAIDLGADIIRIGTHCTEADIAEKHIGFARKKGLDVTGSLMMSHMVSEKKLAEEAKKLEDFGANGVSLYDSAGSYLPNDVENKISFLVSQVNLSIGFHAHNNLGMGIANSLTALQSGALILDASIRGFGAGAGNAQLEVLVAVLEKLKINSGISLYGILDCAEFAEETFVKKLPVISPDSVMSGLNGVFSGFNKHVRRLALQFEVNPRDIIVELGKRKVIGGQEDIIVQVAHELKEKSKKSA